MSTEQRPVRRPVRIELATSELEGGDFHAWADHARVLTVLAVSHPAEAFSRILVPRLAELSVFEETGPTAERAAGDVPRLVRHVVDTLRETHGQLYRENRSLLRDPQWVQLTCAIAEEDRIYFLKGAPAWICLLRAGRAWPAGRMAPRPEIEGVCLGKTESLNLEMTSLAVNPGDTVILLASDTDLEPDLHAVLHLFGQTSDLKRACDGLVNLLGLQSQGAAAVAIRFLPVGPEGCAPWENPLTGLTEEMEESVAPPPGQTSSGPAQTPPEHESENAAIDLALDQALGLQPSTGSPGQPTLPPPFPPQPGLGSPGGEPSEALGWSPRLEPPYSAPPPAASVEPSRKSPDAPPPPEPAPEDEPAGAVVGASAMDPAGEVGPGSARSRGPAWRRPRSFFWPLLLVLLVALMGFLMALPRAKEPGGPSRSVLQRLFSGGGGPAGQGILEVAPNPPAQGVYVDGALASDATPARIEGVPAGRRRIGLDLGPCGIWETTVELGRNATARVAPELKGSVEVATADPSVGGRMWAPGREKTPVPGVLQDLPVGWNRLFYEDSRIPMWDRMVLVRAGQTSQVTIPNAFSEDHGVVKIEALLFEEGEGLLPSTGDTVWVDGESRGFAPLEVQLHPGLHSIRVGSGATGHYAEVIDVKAGSIRHVLAQVGNGDRPGLRHVSPGRVLVRGPLLLTVAITEAVQGTWSRPTLHIPSLPPGAREVPLSPVEGEDGVYVGMVDPEILPAKGELEYFFTVTAPDGQTVWSDVYRLSPETHWAKVSSSRTPQARDIP